MALLSIPAAADGAGNPDGPEKTERLDSVVVSVSRAGNKTPVTFTMVGKERLRESNPLNSLPMTLSLQPSVVTFNEGGTGLGNSSMTIRGSKGSQINVTLDGITLNEPESQEVFWVNIPSLQSILSSVQVQRGLGTTASGPGAFGASINMNTASAGTLPHVSVDVGRGSWNSSVTSAAFGTGLSQNGFYADAVYSKGYTDGYIRNAKVDSQSLFAVLGWMGGDDSLRLTWLMGDQTSGITWDGISPEQYAEDRRYNTAGEYYDSNGHVHYHDNAVDRYRQQHIHLNYTHGFGSALTWTSTLGYRRGDGYDEYYRQDRNPGDYGIVSSGGAPGSDIIYRKRMANDYYVANTDIRYSGEVFRLTCGANASVYSGHHFGTVLWASSCSPSFDYSSLGQDDSEGNSWYRNVGDKREFSVFGRAEREIGDIVTLYTDIQFRHVGLEMGGRDDDAADISYSDRWSFLNPRAGARFHAGKNRSAYISYAYGNREPGRSDIKENVKGGLSPVRPERMHDIELGYEYRGERFSACVNIYLMEYADMLLETGRLSSSGYAVKENVPRGYRRGIEMAAAWSPLGWIALDGNLTLSLNRIRDYVSYVQVSDSQTPETVAIRYGSTDMLLSPSALGMARVRLTPWKGVDGSPLRTTSLCVDWKYVGRQYIDNTSRREMEIPSYDVMNLSVGHEFNVGGGSLGLSAYVGNLLNRRYYAYAWRWESFSRAENRLYYGVGIYPQATANVMFRLSYRF